MMHEHSRTIPAVAVSIGDINGIGPELILKSIEQFNQQEAITFIITPPHVLQFYSDLLEYSFDLRNDALLTTITKEEASTINEAGIYLVDIGFGDAEITPGIPGSDAGTVAFESFKTGVDFCLDGTTDGIVTAPISKKSMYDTGFQFPGHTEYLADASDVDDFMMFMIDQNLRVGLHTIHIPLKEVASKVLKDEIKRSLKTIITFLINDCGLSTPSIAVMGLNPHAGEEGSIGDEEQQEILPAIEEMKSDYPGVIDGPFPADSFFGSDVRDRFDAILAMYHDQGLTPFKTLAFHDGVNVTAGLPFVRTSPDHGTAFAIAGKGSARVTSFSNAYQLALTFIKNRAE